jgi:uncharacterized protein (DUF362 family)
MIVTKHTVVIELCQPKTTDEEVRAKVTDMLGKLPGIDGRLKRAKRIFIKLNLGISQAPSYLGRPFDCVDSAVFSGLAAFIRGRTSAQVLVGDGCDGIAPADAARERGHMAIIEEAGFQFVDLHQPPYTRFHIPDPAMFRWYEFSSALQDIDLFVSLAKMKSHHLCGVTLTMKNLFGLPPGPIYGSPRGALHAAIRLPRILADLTQRFAPGICLIDGIVGCNYVEWHGQGGDPVSSGILIAGDNAVATDATAARCMGVDPAAPRGTPPFLRADNHIRTASELGLGSLAGADIDVIGEMPAERKPFSVIGAAELETFSQAEQGREEVCRLAQQYFDERDRYVREYRDEFMVLGKDGVLLHAPVAELTSPVIFRTLSAAGLGLYEVFCKLVQAEEAELRAPYAT